jgi:hypothetical protein
LKLETKIWIGTNIGTAVTFVGCVYLGDPWYWLAVPAGLVWGFIDLWLQEYFVRWPKARIEILRLLSEYGELSGKTLRDANPWTLGRTTYLYLDRLEEAGLVVRRADAVERVILYSVTSAGRAALWSDAQEATS